MKQKNASKFEAENGFRKMSFLASVIAFRLTVVAACLEGAGLVDLAVETGFVALGLASLVVALSGLTSVGS